MSIPIRKAQEVWARHKPVVVLIALLLVGGVAALTRLPGAGLSRRDAARRGTDPGAQAFDRRVEPWRPSTMARSDPEAMVLAGGALGDASQAAGAPKEKRSPGRSPEDWSQYLREKVRGADHAAATGPAPAEASREGGSSRQLEKSNLPEGDKGSPSSPASAPLTSSAAAARSDAAQTMTSARASPAAGASRPSRESRFSASLPAPGVVRGRLGAASFQTAATTQPSGDPTGPGAAATSAAGAGGLPAVPAAIPGVGNQDSTQGGGAILPGQPGSHPCLAGITRDANPSVRCAAVSCMAAEMREGYMDVIAVAMAAHGTAPAGAAAAAGGDMLGGMISKGSSAAADFVSKAGALKQETEALRFHCSAPQACASLESCRDFVAGRLQSAMDQMSASKKSLLSARPMCKSFPVDSPDDGAACKAGMLAASSADRQAAALARDALAAAAAGKEQQQCRSPEPAEQRRWDGFRNALALELEPVLAAIEHPYCPSRLVCEPRGVELLKDGRKRLAKLAEAVPAAADVLTGMPPAGPLSSAVARLDEAIRLLPQDDAQGVALFNGIGAVDRAASQLDQAADAWEDAKKSACH